MSFLLDILAGLGAGQSLLAAAALFFVAWYLFKTIKIGKLAGAVIGGAMMYVIVGIVFIALAAAVGWVDLRPGSFVHAVGAVVDFVLSHGDAVVDLLRGVVS